MSTQPLKDENYYEAELQANLQRAEWAEESRLNNEAIARDLEEARADTYEDEPENNVAAKNDDDVLPVTVDPTTQDIVVTDGDTEYRISEKETEEALEEELPNSPVSYEEHAFIGSEADLLEQQLRRQIAEEKAINEKSELGKKLQAEHKEMLDVHNKFISKRDHADYLFWQEVKRKGQIVRKDFKMGEEVADAAKAAGLNYKESILPFKKSFKATDSTGKVAIKYSGSKAEFHNDYALDPATIKAGCLAVKKSGLKKPCIFAPSHMTAEQKTQFYSLCYENLLVAGYEPDKIKFDNPAFESQIRAKFAGFKAHGGIGDADSVEMTDGLTGGKGLNIKPQATPEELKMTDAAYALFQAADAAANRMMANTAWNQFQFGFETIDKNAVKQINNIANGKETTEVEFMKKFREDKTIVESFKKLSSEMNSFKETYGSFDNAPEKYKDVFRAVELLQKTGFNPDSKNKTWDFWHGGDASTKTLKKMSAGMKGVCALINEQNNFNFATLDKNDMSDIKRRAGVMGKFKSQLEQGDASSASNYSSVMKGSELNAVSNKNSNKSKMFPDNATVYKFNMSGEGVDLYFFAGDGGMQMIAGSGNKYSKPQRTNLATNEIVQMLKLAEANDYMADVKQDVKQEAKPDAPKHDVIDDIEKDFMSPEELKALANGKKPEAAKEAAPAVPEHVPVIDKFTIQSGNKTFDMEFKDGIANHAGVAYVLKKYAGDVDKTVEGILEKNDKVLAIKVLDTLPMDASCLLGAKAVYETREKPELVDNMYSIPGVTGHLVYELENFDGEIKHSVKDRVKLACEAAGITVDMANGVFKTDVHSYSLNEIKMSEVEGEDYSNKQGYYALKDLQKELEKESKKVVGIKPEVDVAETAKNAPADKGVDFVDDDPTDNVTSMTKPAPVAYKAEDAADYQDDEPDEPEVDDDVQSKAKRKSKSKPN
jgi:hypothetical protein